MPSERQGVGAEHLDERIPLAYVYDGDSLRATLYHVKEIQRYRENTTFVVSLTPDGEDRMEFWEGDHAN